MMQKFVFEHKVNHIYDNSLLPVTGICLCPSCDNAITGGKLVSGNKLKNKLSSGEFKTIQNEGESTVWRYFCSVVKALNIPYLNILISSQVNVFASHASPLYKSVG